MNLWEKYKNAVLKNYVSHEPAIKDLPYWRDYLFAISLTYLLPFSLLALIPSIYASFLGGYYWIAIFDAVALLALLVLTLAPGIPVMLRKVLFCVLVYLLAWVLLTALGSFGPGLIYLLAISIFMVIIFPKKYAFAPLYINTGFCALYGLVIWMEPFEVHSSDENLLIAWIAISSNVIFLTAVFCVLIPHLFGSMQDTIEQQIRLREQFNQKNEALEKSIEQTRQVNLELEQFARVASHDLQEPLRMISSFLERIQQKYEDLLDEKGKKYIRIAVDGAAQMRAIILDLLEYSRHGRIALRHESVDLTEIIAEIERLYRVSIEEKNAQIVYENLPVITTAKIPLQQLFRNLIGNSLKYTRKDVRPRIEIQFGETATHWEFRVMDNGIGISPDFHNKLFVLFQRLHDKNEYPGTGIGLAVCKKIVQSLGGEIGVESEAGNGATFYFTIRRNVD